MANSGTFKKGDGRPRRPKGTPNKATAHAREAIALFIDGNTPRLQAWLDQIATQDGPKAAFQCVVDLLEFHVPKLARTEISGKDGGPVSTVVNHIYETTKP
jgi:hypothetical protein